MGITDENIVIEGMDGSGKETQSEAILSELNMLKGYHYTKVSFPAYHNYSGSLVKNYLNLNKGVSTTMTKVKDDSLLYTINRFQTLIDLGYKQGDNNFLFDRYTTSNMLYQTIDMSISEKEEYLSWLTNLEYHMLGLPVPDKIIVLRCTPALSVKNIRARGRDTDFFESVLMQEKIRDNISYFEKHHGWIVVDVDTEGEMKTRRDITNEIMEIIIN